MNAPLFALAASLALATNLSTSVAEDVPIGPALAAVSNLTGPVTVSTGVLRIQDAAALSGVTSLSVLSLAALELGGGIPIGNIPLSVSGSGPAAGGGLRSIAGDNSWQGPVSLSSATVGVDAGSLTLGGAAAFSGVFTKTGPGTLVLHDPLTGSNDAQFLGGSVVSNATSGSPFSDKRLLLSGATAKFAPAGSGADVVLSLGGGLAGPLGNYVISYTQGSSLILDKGANASLTLITGSATSNFLFYDLPPAGSTLVIAASGGFTSLGVSERITAQRVFSLQYSGVNVVVGQDNDPLKSADFLNYDGTNGYFRRPGTDFTLETLTTDLEFVSLKNIGQNLNLNGRTLFIGRGFDTVGPGVLILNGGSISGGTLTPRNGADALLRRNELAIYTSLAGATISSDLGVTESRFIRAAEFTKFGPGVLTLSGNVTHPLGTMRLNSGGIKLDGTIPFINGNGIDLANGATLSGSGTTNASVAVGIISPGGSPGILTVGTTGSQSSSSFTSYEFEFTKTGAPVFSNATASGNDVLRLTSSFSSLLTVENVINIYLNPGSGIQMADSFLGGFFTDTNAPFAGAINNATWHVFVADLLGETISNGIHYHAYEGAAQISTVPQTANFGAGSVNGYITRVTGVTAVPEPGAISLLAAAGLLTGVRRRRPRPA